MKTLTRPITVVPPPEEEGSWDCPGEDTAGGDE